MSACPVRAELTPVNDNGAHQLLAEPSLGKEIHNGGG
jgi:hypothetical protein